MLVLFDATILQSKTRLLWEHQIIKILEKCAENAVITVLLAHLILLVFFDVAKKRFNQLCVKRLAPISTKNCFSSSENMQ